MHALNPSPPPLVNTHTVRIRIGKPKSGHELQPGRNTWDKAILWRTWLCPGKKENTALSCFLFLGENFAVKKGGQKIVSGETLGVVPLLVPVHKAVTRISGILAATMSM